MLFLNEQDILTIVNHQGYRKPAISNVVCFKTRKLNIRQLRLEIILQNN